MWKRSGFILVLQRCEQWATMGALKLHAPCCAGRLASSNPNMQSVPAHDDRGRLFRSAFTADEGHLLVAADYSQVSTGGGDTTHDAGRCGLCVLQCIQQLVLVSAVCHWGSDLCVQGAVSVCCQSSVDSSWCGHYPACSESVLRVSLRCICLQVELRVMAALSGDEALQAAFAEGQDVHAATAREVLGKGMQVLPRLVLLGKTWWASAWPSSRHCSWLAQASAHPVLTASDNAVQLPARHCHQPAC